MQTPTPCRPGRAGTLLLTGLLVWPLSLPGQTPARPSTAADESIVLSPFQVTTERDTGYVATNTLAGSRLNTSLRDTPASISVMTKDFLDDIGALNLSQAMEYALSSGNDIGGGGSNVAASTGNGLVGNDFNFQIRGYRSATQTRDYFDTLINADAFNLERVDIARGPNSILFGIGSPGGIINTTPKRARLDRPVTEINFVSGRWDLRRGAIDVSRPLIDDKLALRTNLMVQRAGGFRDFESDDQERGALALEWQATATTRVRVSGELGHMKQNKVRPWMPYDQISQWRAWGGHFVDFGTPQAPTVLGDADYSQFQSGAGNGLPAVPANPFWGGEIRTAGHLVQPNFFMAVMDGPLAGKVLYTGNSAENARWYRTSSGSGVGGYNSPANFDDESVFPRRGNITGPGQLVETDYHTVGVTLEQRIGRSLHLEASANRSKLDRRNQQAVGFAGIAIMYDVTTTLPTFRPDGRYDATIGGPSTGAFGQNFANKLGIPYEATTQGRNALNLNNPMPNPQVGELMVRADPQYSLSEAERDDLRVSASYDLDLGNFGRHMLLAFGSRAETTNESENFREGNIHPNRTAPNHFTNVPARVYHIDPFSSRLADRGIPDPFISPIVADHIYGMPNEAFQSGFVRDNLSRSINRIDSGAFAAQSRFFQNRLVTTAGVRRDRVRVWNRSRVLDTATGVATGLTPAAGTSLDQRGTTHTLGAVFHVPRVDWLSIFGNTSTNFRGQGGAQFFDDEALRRNREIGAVEGKGVDYGLKFNLLDGRVNATLSRFTVDQENQVSGHQNDVVNYIDAIWTTLRNNGPVTTITDRDHPDGHRVGGTDTRSQRSEGWELEVTANPTRDWRLTFNVSKAENAISRLGGALSEYIERNRGEWQSRSSLAYDVGRPPGNLTNAGGSNTVGALITGLDNWLTFVRSQEGQIETNIRPWNANAFTAYTFNEGRLKGLLLGGGANYRGEAILGVKPATLADPNVEVFKGGDYILFNALVGYDFTLRNRTQVRIRLNVDNLFDNQDKQVLASSWHPVLNDLQTFHYFFNPRSYKLSVSFNF